MVTTSTPSDTSQLTLHALNVAPDVTVTIVPLLADNPRSAGSAIHSCDTRSVSGSLTTHVHSAVSEPVMEQPKLSKWVVH